MPDRDRAAQLSIAHVVVETAFERDLATAENVEGELKLTRVPELLDRLDDCHRVAIGIQMSNPQQASQFVPSLWLPGNFVASDAVGNDG